MADEKSHSSPTIFQLQRKSKKIKKHDGTPIAETTDPTVVTDVADRLNEDEAQ